MSEDGWRPIETAPMDGRSILVKLSSGRECLAEYWAGPEENEDWGGWAVQMTNSFIEGTINDDCDADMVAWKPWPWPQQREMDPPE